MFNFLKNALVRGLVILIPLVILYVTFRELLEIMVGIATPIADLFPADTFSHESETEIIAIGGFFRLAGCHQACTYCGQLV